jgi:hypothetical protein
MVLLSWGSATRQKYHVLLKCRYMPANDSVGPELAWLYRTFQEEKSVFWEVIVSVIPSKKILFMYVSYSKLLHSTVPKLLIRKRYYVLFLIPVFIVQVTKLVQFTQYNTFRKIPPSSWMHFATRVRTWRVARLYSVQCNVQWNSSISETVRNRTCTYTLFCLEWPILWLPRILTFPPEGTSCADLHFVKRLTN